MSRLTRSLVVVHTAVIITHIDAPSILFCAKPNVYNSKLGHIVVIIGSYMYLAPKSIGVAITP